MAYNLLTLIEDNDLMDHRKQIIVSFVMSVQSL